MTDQKFKSCNTYILRVPALLLVQFLDLNQTSNHSQSVSKLDLKAHYNMALFN